MPTNFLPKLKKTRNTKKKYHYKLDNPVRSRRLAINEGILYEHNMGKTLKRAATSKKGRLNILRIYRRYNKINECNTITDDMKYIDRKYNLGKTRNICGTQKSGKTKKRFLFNNNNPKKSFDVYIDKDPSDTINIKYTTIEDVKQTINKLERLYKNKRYTHKRIWQVAMIMKVRLGAILKHKETRYKKAKNVIGRYKLANKYLLFLRERTNKKGFTERSKMAFDA